MRKRGTQPRHLDFRSITRCKFLSHLWSEGPVKPTSILFSHLVLPRARCLPLSRFPMQNSGGTPQPNPWTRPNSGTKEWIEFFRDYRIGHQLRLADDSYCSNLWTHDIAPRLHLLFEDLMEENNGKEIRPSLLHGDLWSGNIGSADGQPSIFDPAVYWGHHEAEWGVSTDCVFFFSFFGTPRGCR